MLAPIPIDGGAGSVPLRINLTSDSEEAYRLSARLCGDTGEIALFAGVRGVNCALATLRQAILSGGGAIPSFEIDDSPSFPVRGAMLDVSRDRVPRQDELYRIVDLLARLKFNQLQLYTEHTFAYLGHEEVWRDGSPMTPGEIEALDDYCSDRGIELVPNQNCFGHMERWLKHPRYAPLAETHDFWEWNGRKLPGPFSLCPGDAGSIRLVEDLLGQLTPHFRSRMLNIGCDEALDIGQGRSRKVVARLGSAAVYFEFLQKIAATAERLGRRPMFWADIALSHPESLGMIPEGMIALAWGYEPDSPFREWVGSLNAIGRETWVCPGTSSWRSITGRTTERRGNLAAAGALAGDATGFLATDWGDAGHRQQWPVSLLGLAEAAGFAWNGGGSSFDSSALSTQLFDDASGETARWLERLGDADLPLRLLSGRPTPDGAPTKLANSSALFNELHKPLGEPHLPTPAGLWEEVVGRLTELHREIPPTADLQLHRELEHTVRVALAAGKKALYRRQRTFAMQERVTLAAELEELTAEHRELWLIRSRPGGLDDSVRHYFNVIGDLRGTL